ncbi:hypothetical protein E8P82_01650 [Arthrobacter echini]|uniref:Uncharacterized protein n=1 Tax=Arthrobacter echini TaxID=1529066 RepID=A0A4S5EAJ1_9MICC|nr:hypothetical protein [Arthrobacter echini]THJ68632.1 hypothetical protein E8P82_01650 [Arthrobacter echini]
MTDGLRPVTDDAGLVIQGGVGGIRFQWEELDDAARELSVLAAEVEGVALAVAFLDRDLVELPWRIMRSGPPDGIFGPHYQSALAQVHAAETAALEISRTLESTEARLRASIRAYQLADDIVRSATEAVRTASVLVVRKAAREAIEHGSLRTGPIDLRRRDQGTQVPFEGTVEGILDRLTAVENDAPGTFEVLRSGSAESPFFVVVLPGTQSGLIDGRAGSNPFDVGGIAEALAEDSHFMEAAVREALETAGAGAADPVMIAGHSQGGLHAVNLADPEGLGGRFEVQLVVTAGSPTGWQATGPAEYLHLEHRDDLVPGLDATPNEDDRHRTTVRIDNPVPGLGRRPDGTRESWGLGPAHKLENYTQGARLIDASDAPSLAPSVALLAAAGAPGTARRYSFTAVRRRPRVVPSKGRHTPEEPHCRSRLGP